jgi:hypothetical protein
MRYSPDTQFIMVAFACVTLLKLKQKSNKHTLAYNNENEVRKTVSQTAASLERLAMDQEHSPALFASFLRHILRLDELRERRSTSTSAIQSSANTPVPNKNEETIMQTIPMEGSVDLPWLTSSDQLLFNNAYYSAPSQACLGDDFWDSLLPNLSRSDMQLG